MVGQLPLKIIAWLRDVFGLEQQMVTSALTLNCLFPVVWPCNGGRHAWRSGFRLGNVGTGFVLWIKERSAVANLSLILSLCCDTGRERPRVAVRDHEWALHGKKFGDLAPMNALHALVMRYSVAITPCIRRWAAQMVTVSVIVLINSPYKSKQAWISVCGIRVRVVQGHLGKTPILPKLLSSRGQLRGPHTSQVCRQSPTFAHLYLADFTHSLAPWDLDYTSFQCLTHRRPRWRQFSILHPWCAFSLNPWFRCSARWTPYCAPCDLSICAPCQCRRPKSAPILWHRFSMRQYVRGDVALGN